MKDNDRQGMIRNLMMMKMFWLYSEYLNVDQMMTVMMMMMNKNRDKNHSVIVVDHLEREFIDELNKQDM